MTRKERLIAAISGKPIDTVPHSTYNIHPYLPTLHSDDNSYAEILTQIKETAGVSVKIAGMLSGHALSKPLEGATENVTTRDADGYTVVSTLHTPKGDLASETRVPNNQPPYTMKRLVESDSDMERYLSIPYETPDVNIEPIKELYGAVGENGIVFVTFEDPMYAIASLMDYEDFCIKTITNLDSLEYAAEWACERSLANVKLICEACKGMDVILHTSGPELCTPPMVSPEVFPVLVTPYLRRIIDVVHSYSLKAAIHCHGHIREVFPEIIRTGADLLEPIEPPEQGNISLAELLSLARGRIALMGHVQDQELYYDNPGHFDRWTEYVASVVGGSTGFIMSPTCTPFSHPCPDIYKRNYLEWLRAADRAL